MNSDQGSIEIVICLGSSCFARGNSHNLADINAYVQSHGLNATIRMTGELCRDECLQGPNLSIGGETYHGVTSAKLHELLQQLGKPSGGAHGAS
jgi:NADH:ubiquinone oxidoreductase subunit E